MGSAGSIANFAHRVGGGVMRLSRRLVDDNHPVHALLDHFCILLHTSSPSSAPLALHRWLDAAVNVPSHHLSHPRPTPPPHGRCVCLCQTRCWAVGQPNVVASVTAVSAALLSTCHVVATPSHPVAPNRFTHYHTIFTFFSRSRRQLRGTPQPQSNCFSHYSA